MIDRILFVYPEPYYRSGGGIATYLKHAISAHLAAGRKVHLLTWTTGESAWASSTAKPFSYQPLTEADITEVHFTEEEINRINPTGLRAKNISDLLFPHVTRIEKTFGPDVIEGSDYLVPLHSYLERRRCGLHPKRATVCIFNHGLHIDIWPASAIFPSDATLREFALESQVLQWSDLVLAPSQTAYDRLKPAVSSTERLLLLREPFEDRWNTAAEFPASKFIYFGRVSFAKGVDIFAGLLASIQGHWPISQVTFVGRREWMPFRCQDAKEYLLARLGPELHGKVEFLEQMDRGKLAGELRNYGYFGNFSRTETFSYATVEAVAAGAVPMVQSGTAMAELLPPHLVQSAVFARAPFRTSEVLSVLSGWRSNYAAWISETQAHLAKSLSYEVFNRAYEAIEPKAVPTKTISSKRYNGDDVTVLIATYNDADLAEEAIASVRTQSTKVNTILVLDDGTRSESHVKRLDRLAADGEIRLIRVRNMGLVSARNVLVENAKTDLVIFLDADDRLNHRFVEKTLAALNSAPELFSAAITRRKNFGINDHETGHCLLGTDVHWVLNDLRMTALIKRSVLSELAFDPIIRNGEADDWWWWLRFSLNGHQAAFVPEPLFLYRTVQGTMSWPWSEGQAVLTVELLKRAIEEASQLGIDVSNAHKLSIMGMYRNARNLDLLLASSSAVHQRQIDVTVPNRNATTANYIVSKLVRVFGDDRGTRLARSMQALAYSRPAVRRASRTALSMVGKMLSRRD